MLNDFLLKKYFNFLFIFNYMDVIEVIFFSCIIYAFVAWLSKDKQKNLVLPFYGTATLFVVANITKMQTITDFFILFWPGMIMIFILIHQDKLQKNFIALKKILPAKANSPDENRIEIFMRACLDAMNRNKEIMVIIEGNNSLNEFVSTSYMVNTPINKELADIIISSPALEQSKMIWVSHNGDIKAINVTWNIKDNNLWVSDEVQVLDERIQNAIIFTSKIDCMVFKINPERRMFDIILNGRLIENTYPNSALKIIHGFIDKLVLNKDNNLKKGEIANEDKLKNKSFTGPIA